MKANIFILLLFSLSLLSCDPYILRVTIDSNGFEKSFNFECGKVDVRGSVLADRQIHTYLNFKLNSPIVINPDKLEIIHKGELLTSSVYLENGGGLIKDVRNINSDGTISIVINQVVQSGDTITVNIDNFILCNGNPLEIGNISLVFVAR
ncbi:hypothetical protein [Candidatus Symbiothrix dinenymphae]|uniref:hypothetical protein n=1 Tax=Candidatus Symbiothrix dinenymphae TaxID=467085 RepID=UPI0007033043|nr:hypothetical protein [Candidatus Symbiothrix dinenymphae]